MNTMLLKTKISHRTWHTVTPITKCTTEIHGAKIDGTNADCCLGTTIRRTAEVHAGQGNLTLEPAERWQVCLQHGPPGWTGPGPVKPMETTRLFATPPVDDPGRQ
uniref:Uncharacterized protein n=1 Tax=Eutreptiella gymnastica TaxID=73025 RepID=A0A7S4D309_9EUGL